MENKKGWVGIMLAVIGVIIFVLILIAIGFAIYLYNYHVFETVRICIGEPIDTMYPCNSTQECIDFGKENNVEFDIEGAPEFIRGKLQEVVDEAVYCDETCFVKDVRGINKETHEIEMIDACEDDEIEVSAEIRGKEGLEIFSWMKSQEA